MWVVHAAFLFVCQAIWRWTKFPWAGRVLVRALGSTNGNVRMIAGMFLVRAGGRAENLLEESLARRENLPMVLSVLADIGDRKVEPRIRELAEDRDPQIAEAAKNALSVLAAQR